VNSLHHDDQATLESLVAMAGAKLHYLPPYSPEPNPVEMAFGSVLGYLRAHSSDPHYLAVDGYYALLDDAFRSIDYRKASSFIGHMYTELMASLFPARGQVQLLPRSYSYLPRRGESLRHSSWYLHVALYANEFLYVLRLPHQT
jgi:hypothetical protein